jgi:pimeloyl-ACP methyl ester carboxylesterase
MATFVLVHGAWHGSWCWKRVRAALRNEGHEVFTPTLSGLAERSHLLAPDIDLDTHILDVVNLIRWEELTDIVLCGHSYGGFVVTGVADRLPEKIRALVYLDAFVPDDGENLLQLAPQSRRDHIESGLSSDGSASMQWKVPPIPAAVFNVNSADRDWVDKQCTSHPLGTLMQPIRLTGGIETIPKIIYVRATEYEKDSPFPPFEAKAMARAWKVIRVASGHDVMLDAPEACVELLLDASSA